MAKPANSPTGPAVELMGVRLSTRQLGHLHEVAARRSIDSRYTVTVQQVLRDLVDADMGVEPDQPVTAA